MNMTPEKYIDRMKELLLKKKALLLDIITLTKAQTEALTEDGVDGLNNLISGKQLKIDEINKLDEEFSIYYQRLKSISGISSFNQLDAEKLDDAAAKGAKQLKGLTAEILDVIRNISEIEKVNSQKSNRLLQQFGKEIKKINHGKKVNSAYNPVSSSEPSYFLDKKK